MKKIIGFAIIVSAVSNKTNAQDLNPYQAFGYKSKYSYVMSKYPEGLQLTNTDTSSNVQRLILSFKTREVFYLASPDSAFKVVSVPAKDILRFLSVDPLTRQYPMLTPYQYASNRPIDGIDLDGLEYLPYHKSMYRMQYNTTTDEVTMTSGALITYTNAQTVVNTVYENIPSSIKDAATRSFTHVGGPVTTMGRDYSSAELSGIMYDRSKYFAYGPQFFGTAAGGKSTSGIQSLKGNATQATGPLAQNINSAGSILGPSGAGGIIMNQVNVSSWKDLRYEGNLRAGFYSGTQLVDNYRNTQDWKMAIPDEASRVGMINFITDGYLPTAITNQFTGSEYQSMRLGAYEKQLNTAWYGLQIMQTAGIPIREQTKTAVQDLLKKYKADGGTTNYDTINQLLPSTKNK